jgi:phosphohistidine phosphatase
MKTLYLIRHAKSSWKDMSLSDFDRPLNKRGKNAAPLMGSKLKEKGVLPDFILSSPANRALTTAKVIAKEVGYPKGNIQTADQIYHAATSTLLQVVCELDDSYDTVFMFGHNPGFTDFANYLTGSYIGNVPTCGVVHIAFEATNNWAAVSAETGTLVEFDFPKHYGDY